MEKITVKYLKEWLDKMPDDALIYNSQCKMGEVLRAIDPYKTTTESGHKVFNIYAFPTFPSKPLTTQDDIDWLNRYYETMEWWEKNTNK